MAGRPGRVGFRRPAHRCALVFSSFLLLLGASHAAVCPVYTAAAAASRVPVTGGNQDLFCNTQDCGPTQDGSIWSKACDFSPRYLSRNPDACSQEQVAARSKKLGSLQGDVSLRPCDLWPLLHGRTLWIVGDSHMKSLFMAFGCFFYHFWDRTECAVHKDKGIVDQLYSSREGSPIEASCIHLPGKTRICLVKAVLGTSLTYNDQAPEGGVMRFLHKKLAKPGDIFYLSFAAWHRKRPTYPYNSAGFDMALANLAQYYKDTKVAWPHVFFGIAPAAHPNWSPNSATCPQYPGVTLAGGSSGLRFDGAAKQQMDSNPYTSLSFKQRAESLLGGSGIAVLGELSFKLSVASAEQHVGRTSGRHGGAAFLDCIHYCNPGIPQLWLWELNRALQSGQTGIKPLTGKQLPPLNQMVACTPTGTSVL